MAKGEAVVGVRAEEMAAEEEEMVDLAAVVEEDVVMVKEAGKVVAVEEVVGWAITKFWGFQGGPLFEGGRLIE